MRAVIQRVTSAKVEVEGKVTGEIEKGFLILFAVLRLRDYPNRTSAENGPWISST